MDRLRMVVAAMRKRPIMCRTLPTIRYHVDILPTCVLLWENESILINGQMGRLITVWFEPKIDKALKEDNIDLT